MPDKLDEYNRLIKRVEKLQADTSKAEGSYEQLMEELQEKYGCSTIEEAEHLLEEKEKEARKLRKRFERELKKFNEEWEILQ